MKFKNILIVDDHPVVRMGVKAIIAQECKKAKIECAASFAEAGKYLAGGKKPIDLLLLDIQLPDGDGLSLIDKFKEKLDCKVIVFTMHEELWLVNELLQSKADGIVLKGDDSHELVMALYEVEDGLRYLSRKFQQVETVQNEQDISEREQEILSRICKGESSTSIAREMGVSKHTVDFHRHNLMLKTGTTNVAQLVAHALRKGMLPLLSPLFALLLTACGAGGGSSSSSLGDSLRMEVESLNSEGLYEQTIPRADSALAVVTQPDSNRAHLLYEKGFALICTGKCDSAIASLEQASQLMEKYDDKAEDRAIFLSTTGVAYRRLGRNEDAIETYAKALKQAEQANDPATQANLHNNIGTAYLIARRFNEALDHYARAERLGREANDTLEIYSALSSRAEVWLQQGQAKRVISLMKPTIDSLKADGQALLVARCASYLLDAYVQTHQLDTAESFLQSVQPYVSQLPPGHPAINAINHITCHLREGQGRYREALEMNQQLLNQPNLNKQETFRSMAHCHAALGNHKEATALADSAYNELERVKNSNIDMQMSQFSIKYETREKELALTRLQAEKAEQKARFTLVLAVTFLLLGIAVTFIVWKTARRKIERRNEEVARCKRYIEGMENERSRLARELHDGICNDLLGIGMILDAGDPDGQASALLANARKDVREVSHALMPPRFHNTDLRSLINYHIGHVAAPGINVNFSCEENDWNNLPHDVAFQLYRVYQEAMNNAIAARSTDISVSLLKSRENVTMTVSNTFPHPVEKTDSTGGIGSRTIATRAASIGGTVTTQMSGQQHTLTVTAPCKATDHAASTNEKQA